MLRVDSRLTDHDEQIVTAAIDCGYTVHVALGPGFREKIYQQAYRLELASRGLQFEAEKPIQVHFKQWAIPGQRVDLIVEGLVVVEIKAIPRLMAVHDAQVLSYLRTAGLPVGLLMNFNTVLFKQGIRRLVNGKL